MGKRVLVVDDEPVLVSLVATALSREGYEVHTAHHPVQAFEAATTASPGFDLLVSDVTMPGMSGPELVRSIKRVCPNIAVVLMSADFGSVVLPEGVALISKPFGIKDLYSIVEKAFSDSNVPESKCG